MKIFNLISKENSFFRNSNMNKTEKLICDYILELFIVINFPSSCDNQCQRIQLNKLTSNKNLFGDLPNNSLKFILPDLSLLETPAIFHVYDFRICKSIEKYFFKIKSFVFRSNNKIFRKSSFYSISC
jgi:hypothetical protein